MIHRYMGKISAPLLDRIDLHIDGPAVSPSPAGLLRFRAASDKVSRFSCM